MLQYQISYAVTETCKTVSHPGRSTGAVLISLLKILGRIFNAEFYSKYLDFARQ